MNFLDPNEWNDLENLEKEHEELTEDLVKQLHNRLRPYFLRRIKSEVLQLPPKVWLIGSRERVFLDKMPFIRMRSSSQFLWHRSRKKFIDPS